jgi:PAS domain-containing protein
MTNVSPSAAPQREIERAAAQSKVAAPGLSLEGVILRTSDQEKTRIPPRTLRAKLGGMPELSPTSFRSGDALFAFGPDLTVISWNRAAEELTGISAEQALGRQCWEVLGGEDEGGNPVCHQGCSTARLVREGWPVSCQGFAYQGARRTAPSRLRHGGGGRRRTPDLSARHGLSPISVSAGDRALDAAAAGGAPISGGRHSCKGHRGLSRDR